MYLVIIIFGLGCILLYRQWSRQWKLPPGPTGWPLVGNAFQQDSVRPHITWSKWAKQFGDVYTISLFGNPTVLCNSPAALWEMLVTKSSEFAGRSDVYHLNYMTEGCKDIAAADFDSQWAYKKKIFTKGIKTYGDGLERLETIMGEIITNLIDDFKKTNQQPTDPLRSIQLALCNTLTLLMTGDKFQHSDSDFLQLLEYVKMDDEVSRPSFDSFLVDAIPLLHFFPLPFSKLLNNFVDGFIRDWIPRIIQRRMAQYDENSIGCILDAFIWQQEFDHKNTSHILLDSKDIIGFCQDFFAAGILTSSGALYIILVILTVKQGIQAKLQAELDQALGGRRPKLQDKQSMPHFQAMLEEVFRYAVITIGFPHKATIDSSICGHTIPKGTQVLRVYGRWLAGANSGFQPNPSSMSSDSSSELSYSSWSSGHRRPPFMPDVARSPVVPITNICPPPANFGWKYHNARPMRAPPLGRFGFFKRCGGCQTPVLREVYHLMIWPNLWHVCHDPAIWEDPWEFRPECFLDSNGEFVPADHPARKNVLIFGAGRRICPGEQLARNCIFLITISLLQSFMLKPSPDDQLPRCDPRLYPAGFILKPQPYKIKIIPRN